MQQQSQRQKRGVAARVANKLWKPCFDRPRTSSKFVRLVGIYILMPRLKNKLRASHVDCRIGLVTLARHYRRICRRKKTKPHCWVVVLKKIGIRGVIQLRSFEHGIESDLWFLVISMCFVWWFSWDIIASRSHLGSIWATAFIYNDEDKMWRQAGFVEMLVSPAKRDQNEMGGLQKRGRFKAF